MTLSEKSAYLKGLMEGMKLDTETNEGKLLAAVVDLLGDMAKTVSDVEETTWRFPTNWMKSKRTWTRFTIISLTRWKKTTWTTRTIWMTKTISRKRMITILTILRCMK